MPQNPLLKTAVALTLAATLAGCYPYPASYQSYGAYPAYAYGGYPGAIFIGGYGGHRRYNGDGGHLQGFNGRPGPGFSHPPSRPGGFFGGHH